MHSREDTALNLARIHYAVEPGMQQIFQIIGTGEAELNPDEPVKLLEVNTGTVASGILPIYFGPSPASGIYHPTAIVEITPDEYERVRTGQLPLPHGWKVGELIPSPVPEPAAR